MISNVSFGDTYNVTDYVASLTNVSYAYYNSKGGLHLGPNGTVTVNLKNTYKVVKYEVMGPTPTQHSIVNTSATVTINGYEYSGVNAADNANWNRVQYEPTTTENVSSFTIKAGNTDVYIKSVGIYIEAEDTPTPEKCATPVFSPASGTFGAGKEITVTCSTPGATINVSDGNDFDINLTSGKTFKLPTAKGEYSYIAVATATGYEASETAYASYTVQWPTCEKPVFNPNGGTVAPGTVVTLTCATAGAEITYYPADNEDDFNLVESGHTFPLPTTPGTYTYKAFADASATFYGQSETVTATYTVTAPVHNEVAPKISFLPEDQKVFGSEEEIDVTLSLNSDVYPVPNVIYYTLDGFMAHNTLETGTPGATPAGHVLEAAVNPSTLSGTVRIERSHREALNHRAVTINAYTFNTAGSDVAAATYIFNDNAAPLPDPKPTTITATVTMANQGWTSGQSPYTADNSFTATWTSDKIVDLDNATISFATVATSEGSSYPAFNSNKSPKGLRFYSTETNNNTIIINVPDDSYRFVSVTFTGTNSLKVQGTTYTSGTKVDLTDKPSSIVLQSAVTSTMAVSKIEFVLEKTAAKAAVAPTTIKTATGDVYTLVTSANDLKAGDIVVIAANTNSKYYAMSTSTTKDKVNGTEVSVKDNKIDWVSDLNEITLEDKSGSFILKCSQGYNNNPYLSSVSTSSNNIKFVAKNSAPAVTLTFQDDNSVKINFSGTTSKLLLCNYNNNSPMFRNYNSGSWSSYGKTYIFKKTAGGNPDPTVEAPVITFSTQAKPSDPVTVTIDCATEGATVTYTVTKDGNTIADNLTYDPASKPVFSEVGSYTVNATASKEGMNPANATPANFTIEKLVEVVEELFFVMDQNLWDVDGAYPETVVPFEYKGNNTYDLDITKIPAKGWYMNKNGIWTAIEHGFRGNFYVRDGKANHKGLVFGATGTVADATFATRAAAAGNQMVEPHTKYNMYVVNEGDTHKVFTTIGDNSSKAFTDGTIRVTHTPGNKDTAKTMTLEILAEDNQTTGVDSITAEDAASDADARFFNLQGVEVPADRLAPGIYIRQAGSKATKVLVK